MLSSTDLLTCQLPLLVRPATPSKYALIALSPFDSIMPETSFNFQFIYKNEQNDTNFMHPDAMKSSLSKLLVDFPLMAGRARQNNEKWYIDCNDAGVSFRIAHAAMKLDDFAYDQVPQEPRVQRTCPEDPIWRVKLTYFSCGGVIVISELFHPVGDGATNAMLMRKWASLHSNKPYSLPVLDRTLIRASGGPPPSSVPLWQEDEECDAIRTRKLPCSSAKLIKFSANELLAMKHAAHDPDDTGTPWVSTNDVLCSHMWRLITKARGLPADTMTSMAQACNVRKYIQPPLTSDYVGNVLMFARTDMISAYELEGSSLARISASSRRSISLLTSTLVQDFIDWISSGPSTKPVGTGFQYGPDVAATSWVAFNMYSVVFENDEPPHFVGQAPPFSDGLIKLVEGKEKGSINIQLSLPQIHMDNLLADPELHKYANVQ
ncbi:hypothetical protein K7432_001091 [Basidiobolus ranarum]|uniref:Uncharacterized protein n=1 Tax=Basidiobolus ranarum TaxID=34480 RepID=A0ABR2X3K6_9FUNG